MLVEARTIEQYRQHAERTSDREVGRTVAIPSKSERQPDSVDWGVRRPVHRRAPPPPRAVEERGLPTGPGFEHHLAPDRGRPERPPHRRDARPHGPGAPARPGRAHAPVPAPLRRGALGPGPAAARARPWPCSRSSSPTGASTPGPAGCLWSCTTCWPRADLLGGSAASDGGPAGTASDGGRPRGPAGPDPVELGPDEAEPCGRARSRTSGRSTGSPSSAEVAARPAGRRPAEPRGARATAARSIS